MSEIQLFNPVDNSISNGLTMEIIRKNSEKEIAEFIAVTQFLNRFKFCKKLGGWLEWDTNRWKGGDLSAASAYNLVGDTLISLGKMAYCTQSTNASEEKEILSFMRKCKSLTSAKGVYSILSSISNMPLIVTDAKDFDKNPLIINTPSGIINLETGELIKHEEKMSNGKTTYPTKKYLCTKITSCSMGDKGLELWKDFVSKITCGDTELAEYLQIACGSCIIGRVYEEVVFFLNGKRESKLNGSNGKSTFVKAIQFVLNDYAGQVNPNALLYESDGGRLQNEAASNLLGKRFVVAGEIQSKQGDREKYLSETGLKKLASRDIVNARKLYVGEVSFEPTHHIIATSNHIPELRVDDYATKRRIVIIPFNNQFTRENTPNFETGYDEKLTANCKEAILQWLIQGAMCFLAMDHKLPFPQPNAVKIAIMQYLSGGDPLKAVQMFITEREITPDKEQKIRIRTTELYNQFKDWAADSKEWLAECGISSNRISRKVFAECLTECGFSETEDRNHCPCFSVIFPQMQSNMIN